jgi:hypothetical protein
LFSPLCTAALSGCRCSAVAAASTASTKGNAAAAAAHAITRAD